MKAVIPVAGYATRLYPLTENTAKALLTVGGKEILAHFLDKLEGLGGFNQVVLVSNHKFYEAFTAWAAEQSYSFSIKVINDGTTTNENRLGAVGDFVLGLQALDGEPDHVLISAGDGIFEDDFEKMMQAFRVGDASIIATKESPLEVCKRCGVAKVDAKNRLISFVEKPELPPSNLVGIMTYMIHRDHVPHLHAAYQNWEHSHEMNAGEAIRYLVEVGAPLFAYPIAGVWFDIGTIEHLEEARRHFGE
jgi:glucose-1-phosphate thymidylyltransferase